MTKKDFEYKMMFSLFAFIVLTMLAGLSSLFSNHVQDCILSVCLMSAIALTGMLSSDLAIIITDNEDKKFKWTTLVLAINFAIVAGLINRLMLPIWLVWIN